MYKRFSATLVVAGLMIAVLLSLLHASAAYSPAVTNLQQKETAHAIANQARSLGLPEDDPIIVRAKELWHQAHEAQTIEATMLAKTIYNEGRGIPSDTHKACIAWVALNRVDAGYGTLQEVLTAPHQFAYSSGTPVQEDLYNIAWDVLNRWQNEKAGAEDVGRVLPADYLWFAGDGRFNYFRNSYNSNMRWDYALESPYDS